MKDPNEAHRRRTEERARIQEQERQKNLAAREQAYQGITRRQAEAQKNNSTTCFIAGTKIWTPKGHQRIEDLAPGDFVWSRNKRGSLEAKPIIRSLGHPPSQTWIVNLEGGRSLHTTAMHSFCSYNKWVFARNLKPGDLVGSIGPKGRAIALVVQNSKPSGERLPVYNLIVADNFNFFAGNCLVHSFSYLRRPRMVMWSLVASLGNLVDSIIPGSKLVQRAA